MRLSRLSFMAASFAMLLMPFSATAEVTADQVASAKTVKELVALGATKLSAEEFKKRIVGKKMSGDGWTWSVDTDGTTTSSASDGSWKEDKAPWSMKGDKYCATLDGKVKCRDVYMIGNFMRMSDKDSAKKLSPWFVTLK